MAEPKLPDAATILAVDEAVSVLAEQDPDAAQIVKLHFFAGLTLDETAEAMGLSRQQRFIGSGLTLAHDCDSSCEKRIWTKTAEPRLFLRRFQPVLSHW